MRQFHSSASARRVSSCLRIALTHAHAPHAKIAAASKLFVLPASSVTGLPSTDEESPTKAEDATAGEGSKSVPISARGVSLQWLKDLASSVKSAGVQDSASTSLVVSAARFVF